MGEDNNQAAVSLLQASVGNILVLQLSCDAIAANCGPLLEVEASIVAPGSGGLWGAFARLGLPVVFTAIERIVATFARDQVVDMTRILDLLESPDLPPTEARLPKFRKGIAGSSGQTSQQGACEAIERELSCELGRVGLTPESLLVQRIVTLKQLRNECVHVLPKATPASDYFERAGFAGSAQSLGLSDLRQAVDTLASVLQMFSILWPQDGWSAARLDLMSDLPIYVDKLSRQLHSLSGSKRREVFWLNAGSGSPIG